MPSHVLTGIGFGPIQSGLFAYQAFRGGHFSRLVIAEVDEALVAAVRAGGGSFHVNIAGAHGIEVARVDGVEILNPNVAADRAALADALRQSTEVVTALPSVAFFDRGDSGIAALLAGALTDPAAPPKLVYTAENNNHAAEILEAAVAARLGAAIPAGRIQFLNTVIGKMSRVVTDPAEIAQKGLAPLAPGLGRAHLVESFSRILVTRCALPGIRPGIECFIEKDDLLPFEEAKLYGHNAIHTLMGYLGARQGHASMAALAAEPKIMAVAREAFLNECGASLIKKYARLGDELFTPEGFKDYAEDLLERITNPYLDDSTERAIRDPLRKLGPRDRIFGTMALALEHGITPRNMALGAAAALALLLRDAEANNVPEALRPSDKPRLDADRIAKLLDWIWKGETVSERDQILTTLIEAVEGLEIF